MIILSFKRWGLALCHPSWALDVFMYIILPFGSEKTKGEDYLYGRVWDRGGLAGMLNAVAMTGPILLMTWVMTRAKVILKL